MDAVRIIALVIAFATRAHSLDGRAAAPTFAYRDSLACGDVIAYTWNRNRTEQLVVQFDRDRLGVAIGVTRSFRIETSGTKLGVWVDLYPEPAHGTYCTDVLGFNRPRPIVWLAKAGKVMIRTFRIAQHQSPIVPGAYGLEIRIERVTFEGPDHNTITTMSPIILHGQGGWGPA